ncbi:extracellular solute-binding protein [Paenibacillus eucommiae]|uniref:Aldouronate transport system substrate-binding protein n=1 Tax=Paenibacillus eucommiae TaxID=1355755 RepID=A0ABS4IMD4_9BACL|nr:extracellular solute-binding protein [Paenibacillus eucommiae]MBP1988732.1 putative aldouronate transport system substrate-binding protein [Paenibacillus eucommiae]
MKRMSRLALSCLMIVVLIVLSACGTKEPKEGTSTPNTGNTPAASVGNEKAEPVEITMVRENYADVKYLSGESIDKNAVSDAYEKELGIKIKNLWVADSTQYQQKLQMSISSNDIPDLMFVSMPQLQQLIEADMILDLTDIYEKTATAETKAYLTGDGGNQLNSAKHQGKLMAIPSTNSPYNSASHVWLRRDWLKQLNLPEPKTMQDVLSISEAFTKQDPGGSGKSYGIALTKALLSEGAFMISGFFNGYHAYPGQWIKDDSGKLVFGSIQPEMKLALKQLQDMYKDGQIDPEFAVKDVVKENELLASNKIGITYGPFWLSAYPLMDNAVKDGVLVQDWWPYPIVSHDAVPAMTQVEMGVDGYWVVSKKAKHPEAAIKLLNKWIQAYEHPGETDGVYLLHNEEAQNYYKLNPIRVFSQTHNVTLGEVVPKAIESRDPSSLKGVEGPNRYGKVVKYLDGDTSQWSEWPISGPGGTFSIMYQYLQQNRYHINAFYGAPGPVMTEKKPVLDTKMHEVFIKIIMNQLPIDKFDEFVAEWKKLGGDEMTNEVNEWYVKVSQN